MFIASPLRPSIVRRADVRRTGVWVSVVAVSVWNYKSSINCWPACAATCRFFLFFFNFFFAKSAITSDARSAKPPNWFLSVWIQMNSIDICEDKSNCARSDEWNCQNRLFCIIEWMETITITYQSFHLDWIDDWLIFVAFDTSLLFTMCNRLLSHQIRIAAEINKLDVGITGFARMLLQPECSIGLTVSADGKNGSAQWMNVCAKANVLNRFGCTFSEFHVEIDIFGTVAVATVSIAHWKCK